MGLRNPGNYYVKAMPDADDGILIQDSMAGGMAKLADRRDGVTGRFAATSPAGFAFGGGSPFGWALVSDGHRSQPAAAPSRPTLAASR